MGPNLLSNRELLFGFWLAGWFSHSPLLCSLYGPKNRDSLSLSHSLSVSLKLKAPGEYGSTRRQAQETHTHPQTPQRETHTHRWIEAERHRERDRDKHRQIQGQRESTEGAMGLNSDESKMAQKEGKMGVQLLCIRHHLCPP